MLLQLCDSGFPSGAFSHSFGFETYLQEGSIKDGPTFRAWLEAYIRSQWIYNDGFALRLAYERLEKNDAQALWELDRRLTAQTIPREQRSGGIRMGRRMLELALGFLRLPMLELYSKAVEERAAFGQTALLFAVICHHYRVTLRDALLHYAYASTVSLVQNGVRAIPLGQSEGQKMLFELNALLINAVREIEQLSEEDFGIASPGLEMAAVRHERLEVRMFMS